MNENYMDQTVNSAISQLEKTRYQTVCSLDAKAYITAEPVPYGERQTGTEKIIRCGESWGVLWECAWFQFSGKVPDNIPYEDLILCIDVSGEGLVVNQLGEPVQGITTAQSTFDQYLGRPGKKYVPLSDVGKFDDTIEVWADCGCNDLFGNYIDSGQLKQAELVTCNFKIHKLSYDMSYLKNLCIGMKDESYRLRIRKALYNGAICLQDCNFSEESIEKAIQSFSKFLNVPFRYEEDFQLSAVGHAHMDLAWLWPLRETKRKGARTFSTALQMMKQYPDYIFGASQPQLFQWIKEDYPKLYERTAQAIREGRLECQGGMWVEADTNISGGEALLRQFLYGKKFFQEEFDKDIKTLWLPDVFGYSAALPQIMSQAEIDYFMTIKLSWSEHNEFPYHTFLWQGIDGTKILSHMPPEGTYNSAGKPESYQKAVEKYKEKAVSNQALMLFGIGDGGGGPGEDHLEYISRSKTSVGVPIVKQRTSLEFFEDLSKDKDNYPCWNGELYLEKHQGTYTTHAKNKKYNRKLELLLRECEFACSLAEMYTSFYNPVKEIEEIWKEVLLYQFHDILPGSSIQRVYEESQERYEILAGKVSNIIKDAYELLAAHISVSNMKHPIFCFNSLPWERTETIQINEKYCKVTVPSMGWAVYDREEFTDWKSDVLCTAYQKDGWLLENDLVKIIFNKNGTIASYYDKEEERELVPAGMSMNQFALYKDEGDCWDIPFGYRDHSFEQPQLVETQEVRNKAEVGILQTYQVNQSTLKVAVTLKEQEKMLRFSVEVDWHESQKMLRTKFPLAIHSDKAACEIQFGYIERSTCKNTSWDLARIEVPAHKWVDISEKGYGAALLNDCKYGYNLWENTIDMNILRSPKSPSEEEKGIHTLQYALLPHQGTLAQADVVKQGYFFNIPMYFAEAAENKEKQETALPQILSQIQIEKDNIIAEAVKKAKDGNGFIIRLYESKGIRTTSKITIKSANKVMISNALEKDKETIENSLGNISLSFSAFEIKTIRVI